MSSFLLLSPLLEPSLLFFLMSVRSLLGAVAVTPPKKKKKYSKFRLRAHHLKVEAAAWLEGSSCARAQCPNEDEHVQNEVHAHLYCQDHRVVS